MNLNLENSSLTSVSRAAVEPDFLEGNVRVAQAVHLYASDVRLKESFVGVVPDRNDGSVIEHHLFSLAIEVRLPLKVPLPFRLEEEVIHRLVRVTREVAGTSRVEEREEEVIRMRHIGGPRVEEDRELALGKHCRERRPIRLVVELSLDADRRQILLDLLVLLKELL